MMVEVLLGADAGAGFSLVWWMRLWLALSKRRTQSVKAKESSFFSSSSGFRMTSGSHAIDSSDSSGRFAGTSSLRSVSSKAKLPCSRRTDMRAQHFFENVSFMVTLSPWLTTYIISGVRTSFVFSRLMPVPLIFLKLPRTCPKSIWNIRPSDESMMLPLCRSAMPRTYVATQEAAQEAAKRSWAAEYCFWSSLCSTKYAFSTLFWNAPPMAPEPQQAWISAVSLAPRMTSIQPTSRSVDMVTYVRSQHSWPAASQNASICRIDCSMAASWRKSSRILKMAMCLSSPPQPTSAASKMSRIGAAFEESTRQASGLRRPTLFPGMQGRSMPAGSSPLRWRRLSSREANWDRACLSSNADAPAQMDRSCVSRTTCFSYSDRITTPQAPTYAARSAPCTCATRPPFDISALSTQKSVRPT
mmetsp:Transcript_30266/g.102065  ORF Transcript_30266/g.102065 Transcript_30266/m.102065 type:complete len:415 (+) Transcript_30266:316-1560(+)